MHDWLKLTQPMPLSIWTVLFNLALGMGLGLLLGWHYVRFGKTLGNRASLARILVVIVLTTVLLISIVKASLALSLGLVGALSIVRFRTPIKEPEELAYLFLAIATGIGLGADQRLVVVVAMPAILGLLTLYNLPGKRKERHNLYLNIEVPSAAAGANPFPQLIRTVADHVSTANLRRMDISGDLVQATFYVDCRGEQQLLEVIDALQTAYPLATVSFIDQNQTLEG